MCCDENKKHSGNPVKNGNKDKPKPDQNQSEKRIFKGLCINCDNRFTCMLPRPVEGVWHCEEYL